MTHNVHMTLHVLSDITLVYSCHRIYPTLLFFSIPGLRVPLPAIQCARVHLWTGYLLLPFFFFLSFYGFVMILIQRKFIVYQFFHFFAHTFRYTVCINVPINYLNCVFHALRYTAFSLNIHPSYEK